MGEDGTERVTLARHRNAQQEGLLGRLNGRWHELAAWSFMVIVLAHWVEHIAQAYQVFVLGWAPPASLGALGLVWPWLVTSEWMHYGYALAMLGGLILLRPGMAGRARLWWDVALWIQVWHHFEHLLLLGQAISGVYLFGASVPTSIAQVFIPRVELHLLYNLLVFAPMVVAMLYHLFPNSQEAETVTCSCARRLVDH